MKKLVMVAGPAGVGKTAACSHLFHALKGCAWLDGDWCWMVNPYPGKTERQKRYAEKAFGYILDGYLQDENTEIILFSWLMNGDFMFDLVTEQISCANYELVKIALVCEEQEHVNRLRAGNRSEGKIEHPDDMAKYRALRAHVIDTTHRSIEDTAEEIWRVAREERL